MNQFKRLLIVVLVVLISMPFNYNSVFAKTQINQLMVYSEESEGLVDVLLEPESDEIVISLENYTVVNVTGIEREGDYVHIEYLDVINDKEEIVEGYVHESYLIPLSEETSANDDGEAKVNVDETKASEHEEVNVELTNESELLDEDNIGEEIETQDDEIEEENNLMLSVQSSSVLKEGQRGAKVEELKNNLNLLGFHVTMNYPDRFGPATTTAVKEFQDYYGLELDGIVGPLTSQKLSEILETSYWEGQRSSDITTLKDNLNKLGFSVTMNYPDRYGPATTRAVQSFQRQYNLKETGVADYKVLDKIEELLDRPMQEGSERADVKQLKENLNKLGFHVTMNYPKRFGPATTEAVKNFQSYYDLTVNGIVDRVTLNKVNEVLSTSYWEGQRSNDITVLKENLNYLGFSVTMNYPNRYGPSTTKAVQSFQRYYKLKETGVADYKVQEKMDAILKQPMKEGLKRADVIELKENLNKLGFHVTMNYPDRYGPSTTKAVKEFQSYYGLDVDGIAGPKTLEKVSTRLANSLREKQSSVEIKKLKENLNKLGFPVTMDYPNRFGPATTEAVKDFQKAYGISVSGVANDVTLDAIDEALENIEPDIVYTDYGLSFNEAVNVQRENYSQSGYIISTRINIEGQGEITSSSNVNIRENPSTSSRIIEQVNRGTKIKVSGVVKGTSVNGNEYWYKIEYKGNVAYVHSPLVKVNASTSTTANVRTGPGTNHNTIGQLSKDTNVVVEGIQSDWFKIKYIHSYAPSESDIRKYMDPDKNDDFQHLRLDKVAGVSATELNRILKGQGILGGQGQAFVNGARKANINEAYLVAHSFLETGRGTSKLASGVEVGKNKDGKLVLVTNKNRKDLKDIKITYNMFGIGAVDSNPLEGGAKTAYEYGWFTPEKAIEGGAEWIGSGYIYNQHNQNTLYKMRWNPNMSAGYAWKQYATDPGWAVKQASILRSFYNQFDNPTYYFDMPVFK